MKLFWSYIFLALSFSSVAITPSSAQIEQFKKLPRSQQEALAKQYGIDLNSITSKLTTNDSMMEERKVDSPVSSVPNDDDDDDVDVDDDDDDYVTRSNAVAFTIDGKGYVACGDYSGSQSSVYEYDHTTEAWEEKTEFELYARRDAIAFGNSTSAFGGLGRNGTLYLDDFMAFYPNAEQDDDDN